MRTIDIAQILSPDLKSRMRVRDLSLFLQNSVEDSFALDFKDVKFATRSFIDEFYNLFLKDPGVNHFTIELVNVPEDIKAMLDAVSRTQVNASVVPANTVELTFKNVDEFINYVRTSAP